MSNFNAGIMGGVFASVDGDAAAPAFFRNNGFASLVRTAAGVYTMTLAEPIEMSVSGLVQCTPRAATGVFAVVSITSTTVLVVRLFTDAGIASDSDFWIEVIELPPA